MNRKISKAIVIFTGLSFSNFLYQALSGKENWDLACGTSFDQAMVLAMLVILTKLRMK